jgi:hypothetical protein
VIYTDLYRSILLQDVVLGCLSLLSQDMAGVGWEELVERGVLGGIRGWGGGGVIWEWIDDSGMGWTECI